MSNKLLDKHIIVKRYSKALFQLALTSNTLKEVWQDFELLSAVIDNSNKAKAMIVSEFTSQDMQNNLIDTIKSNSSLTQNTYNFLKILVKNRRLYLFDDIKNSLLKFLQENNNELEATVISTIKLNQQQIDEITEALEQKYNKKILCSNQLNAEILGGFVVRIGSTMIDCSLASKLRQFKSESKKNLLTIK